MGEMMAWLAFHLPRVAEESKSHRFVISAEMATQMLWRFVSDFVDSIDHRYLFSSFWSFISLIISYITYEAADYATLQKKKKNLDKNQIVDDHEQTKGHNWQRREEREDGEKRQTNRQTERQRANNAGERKEADPQVTQEE